MRRLVWFSALLLLALSARADDGSKSVSITANNSANYCLNAFDVVGQALQPCAFVRVSSSGGPKVWAVTEDGDAFYKDGPISTFENMVGKPRGSVLNASYSWELSWAAFAGDYVKYCNGSGGRNVVASIQLISGAPSSIASSDYAAVIAGTYDSQITAFATGLAACLPKAYIRIGWEFNCCFPWVVHNATDAAHYVAVFRHVAQVFKAVNSQFQIIWCPNQNSGSYLPENTYPGNDVVDIIALDLYTSSGSDPINGDHLLGWLTNFAAQQNKPMGLGEWGVGDLQTDADNAAYMNKVCNWIKANNVVLPAYYDDCQWRLEYDTFGNCDGSNRNKPLTRAAFVSNCGSWP